MYFNDWDEVDPEDLNDLPRHMIADASEDDDAEDVIADQDLYEDEDEDDNEIKGT